jgi:hypothetical protein
MRTCSGAQLVASHLILSALLAATATVRADDDAPQAGCRTAASLRQEGFVPLFNGKCLAGWETKPWHEGHWVVRDGVIDYDGRAEHEQLLENTLWTEEEFGDFVLYVEWRLPAKPEMKPQPIVLYNGDFLLDENGNRITRMRLDAGDSGILMRGSLKCQANIWSQELGSGEINGYRTDPRMSQEVRRACIPIRKADRPLGQWNAFLITLEGEHMTVVLNGERVIDAARLPDLASSGPIGLQHHGDPVQFRKLWIRSIDSEAAQKPPK